jgi:hypothetical protein
MATAVLIKAHAVFFTVPAVIFYGNQKWPLVKKAIAIAVAMVPSAVYYLFILSSSNLEGQARMSFIPSLFLEPRFYKDWFIILKEVWGVLLIIAFVGMASNPFREGRKMFSFFLAGYLGMAFFFNYHIHTHDYYQLVLAIPISLGFAALCALPSHGKLKSLDYAAIVIGAAVVLIMISQAIPGFATLDEKVRDDNKTIERWSRLGEILRHAQKPVVLCPDYGRALSYYGWLPPPDYWPVAADIEAAKLKGYKVIGARDRIEKNHYDAFLFCTEFFMEAQRQPDLIDALNGFMPAYKTEGEIIFDLKRPRQ